MAVDINVNKHAVAGVSKLLATYGGAHIYNVELTSAADNGNIIGKSVAMKSFDLYTEATPNTFKGVVQMQAANGNWYVEVTEADGALLVYNVPMNPYTGKTLGSESLFYNAAGEVARAHELKVGDVFEVSAEGFSAAPSKGKTITGVASKKLTLGA